MRLPASGVLGMCVMITSALLRTETDRWREESHLLSSSGVLSWGFLAGLAVLAWHDTSLFTLKSSPRQLETFPYHQLASKASLIIATMASKLMANAAFEARLLLRPSHQ